MTSITRARPTRPAPPALGFSTLSMPSYNRSLWALRTWLDSWSGIGLVGMARQGYDLHLTRYDDKGWRATFYTTGMKHSPTAPAGSARRGTRRSGRGGTRCGRSVFDGR
jgi:hypothetical protein